MQLNLEELPNSLFYERWRKNPCEEKLINDYINFSVSSLHQQSSSSQSNNNQNQDHQYMLTRLLQKVQRFVTQNPTIATTLYTSFNEIFVSEVEKFKEPQIGNSKVVPTVKNPLIIRGKGRPSNKRTRSAIESANKSNSKKKKSNENAKDKESIQNTQVIQPLHEIQTQPLHDIQIQPLRETQNLPLRSNSSIQYQYCFEDFLSNELNLGKNLHF